MKTIILHGILAKKFGKSFRLDVKTAKEACHALACQIPAFYEFMMNAEKQGIKFAIFNGEKRTQKTNIGEKQVDDITTASHIHIMPRVIGSGGKTMGWIQVVAGVALIATGVGAGIGAGLTLSAAVAANIGMIGAGAGLLLGGVSALMMPTPKLDPNNEDGNRPNNGFGGAVTTVAQGNPVPILYGEREIGGFIVSAAIYAEDKMVQGVKI
ncbi:Phage tail assembly protein I [Moraxella catarrhalis]|uniref:tail assembly protein n=1 Tax=Moraxella catarrhalis TaxID=480 RepID=UPI0007E645A5|nr:tail assembly protein [Moraxella catarrhalis]OAV37888.1 Phage tail assembly protein I [Moraxella catarrhalis]